jgi:hypothetical protein
MRVEVGQSKEEARYEIIGVLGIRQPNGSLVAAIFASGGQLRCGQNAGGAPKGMA